MAVAALFAAFAMAPTYSRAAPAPAPTLAAPAAIAIDADTGDVLYARAANAREPIASTTKLMTALLTLEREQPTTVFSAPGYSPTSSLEVTIGLARGERMTVGDLLQALLLPSASDAAIDLAVGVSGSVRAFVQEMNIRARSLGLGETHYSSPIGLDAQDNYSSARDLARLAARLMTVPAFAHIVALPMARLQSGSHPRVISNRNDLVGRYPFVTGVKTGHTQHAGYVLVASGQAYGARVVTVVLGEPSEAVRDADSLALLRYGLGQFKTVQPLAPDRPVARPSVRYRDRERVPLVPSHGVTLTVERWLQPGLTVRAPAQLEGPLPRGRRVGTVTVTYHGKPVQTVAILTGTAVKGASLLPKLIAVAAWPLAAAAAVALAALLTLRLGWRHR